MERTEVAQEVIALAVERVGVRDPVLDDLAQSRQVRGPQRIGEELLQQLRAAFGQLEPVLAARFAQPAPAQIGIEIARERRTGGLSRAPWSATDLVRSRTPPFDAL